MLLAVISDIHANLPALEAVLKDIQNQKPDLICCLGDLVNQNVWSKEIIDLIRSENIPCVMGNHDQGIGNGKTVFPFSQSSPEQVRWGKEAITYTLSQVNETRRKFLRELPVNMRFTFNSAEGLFDMLMVHGSPKEINQYVYHVIGEDELSKIIEDAGTHILLMGHTHHPYHKILARQQNNRKIFLHAINAGSVGYPKDGNWRSSYVLIEWSSNNHIFTDPEGLKVTIRRVEYDIDKVVHAIQKSPLPLFYAGRLIKY